MNCPTDEQATTTPAPEKVLTRIYTQNVPKKEANGTSVELDRHKIQNRQNHELPAAFVTSGRGKCYRFWLQAAADEQDVLMFAGTHRPSRF